MVTLEDCLKRWQKNKPKRTAFAQQVIDGTRKIDPNWPQWVQFDIKAEIAALQKERTQARKEHEAYLRNRERAGQT